MAFILSDPLGCISSPQGFSPCLMLISPVQCDFYSVHPATSPCLLPRPVGCVCRADRGRLRSVPPSRCPGHSAGGDLPVPSVPAYVVERTGRLGWETVHPHDWGTPGYGSVLLSTTVTVSPDLAALYSSSCVVNQERKYFQYCLFWGAVPLLVELALLYFPAWSPPRRGSKGLMVAQPRLRAPRLQREGKQGKLAFHLG